MWKWLIGPLLVGTGCIAGSVYGRDAEQLAHKNQADTYAAVEQALDNVPESGTTSFEGGTPMHYQVEIERTPDRQLVATILFANREGARAQFDFTPKDGDSATVIAVRVHGDRDVLSQVLAGTSRARLAYAPDWMLNLAAKPTLQQLAAQIDANGEAAFGEAEPADAATQWQNNLTDDQRNQMQEWQQYDATRPAVDPDAHAGNASGEDAGAR